MNQTLIATLNDLQEILILNPLLQRLWKKDFSTKRVDSQTTDTTSAFSNITTESCPLNTKDGHQLKFLKLSSYFGEENKSKISSKRLKRFRKL